MLGIIQDFKIMNSLSLKWQAILNLVQVFKTIEGLREILKRLIKNDFGLLIKFGIVI